MSDREVFPPPNTQNVNLANNWVGNRFSRNPNTLKFKALE